MNLPQTDLYTWSDTVIINLADENEKYTGVMMKRRDFIMNSTTVILSAGLVSCSAGLKGENTGNRPQQINRGSGGGQSERRTRVSGPTDIKSLSTILQRARCPLTDSQVNYLLTLKQGSEFNQKMNDILDNKQIEAVKNASGGRRGGGGGGRRRR